VKLQVGVGRNGSADSPDGCEALRAKPFSGRISKLGGKKDLQCKVLDSNENFHATLQSASTRQKQLLLTSILYLKLVSFIAQNFARKSLEKDTRTSSCSDFPSLCL